MADFLWVGLILLVVWASLPVSLIIANRDFDHSVVKPGEDHH